MSIKNLEIIPLIGFGDFKFGTTTMSDIKKALGEPSMINAVDENDYDNSLTSWIYEDIEVSFFFDNETDILIATETSNYDAVFLGEKIFNFKEKKVMEFMSKKGYVLTSSETLELGEKILSYDKLLIDFYFDNGELFSISWSSDAISNDDELDIDYFDDDTDEDIRIDEMKDLDFEDLTDFEFDEEDDDIDEEEGDIDEEEGDIDEEEGDEEED